MLNVRIPALVKWTFVTGLLFLLLMTILRVIFFFTFQHAGNEHYTDAFLLGFRYDLRMACIVVLPAFLIGSMHIRYHRNRLTAASKTRLLVSLLFVIGAILFLRNNKSGVITLASVGILYVVILFFLFRINDLNPFAGSLAKKIWLAYFYIATLLFTFLYAVDFQHYDYLHQRLNASVLSYTEDAKISLGMVWESYPVVKIIIGIVVFVVAIGWVIKSLYKWCKPVSPGYASLKTSLVSIIFFLLLACGIFGKASQYPLRWSDAYTLGSDYKANLALNPLQSFFSSLRFKNSVFDLNKVKAYYPLMAEYLGVQKPDTATLNFTRFYPAKDTAGKKPNVILVICESFSGYKSSMWGNPLNTTPYFNQLCQQGVFFDHCFTPAYGTARGVWAIITGIPDVEAAPNTASRNPAAVNQRTIVNDFKGYEKFYFLGGSTSWANIRGLLTNNIHGLHLFEEGSYKSPSIDVWGISDKQLFYEANDIFKTQANAFFAVIQTSGNHRPYTIPSEDKDFKKLELPVDTLRKYGFEGNDEYNAFRYTDYCFKKFMDTARMQSYFNNTIFVFIGDHGIRGNAGAMLPKTYTELGLTTQHVPLLFYSPAFLMPQRRSDIASQIDVLPSIAGATGIAYTNYTLGKDLFSKHDSSLNNVAFLFDPDKQLTGTVSPDFCYIRQGSDGKELLLPMKNNMPVPDSASSREKLQLSKLTEAFYQTAKYMILNNK